VKILEDDVRNVVISQRQAEKIYLFGFPGKPGLITLGIVASPASRTPQSSLPQMKEAVLYQPVHWWLQDLSFRS